MKKMKNNSETFYKIENWYPVLKDLTMKSYWVEIKLEELRVLKKFKEDLYNLTLWDGRKKLQANPQHSIGSDWSPDFFDSIEKQIVLSPEELLLLENIEKRLDGLISRFPGGAIVKLSNRSPKDAVFYTHRMQRVLSQEIQTLSSKSKSFHQNQIDDVIAFTRAKSLSLRVFNGKEALQLLLRSKRLLTDISFAINTAEKMGDKNRHRLQLVVREWSPKMLPEWEFRLFIFEGKLTACSQFHVDCYVPEIHQNAQRIKQLIANFYEKEMQHLVPDDLDLEIAIDVAVCPSLDEVVVRDVRSSHMVAGTALYKWKNQRDREILSDTLEKEMDFRVLSEMPAQCWESLHSVAKSVICEERGYTMDVFTKKKSSRGVWITAGGLVVVCVSCYWYWNKYYSQKK